MSKRVFTISFWTILWLLGPSNFCLVHVSLVPVLNVVGEQVPLVVVAKSWRVRHSGFNPAIFGMRQLSEVP